jgi:F420-non-reducing hydrogenase iron-sulfur subunit
MNQDGFEPRIVAFMCNWCAYGAADLAGVSRLRYPANIRLVRVMCSATVSPHHILRAFQSGADGVMVGG